MDRFADNAQSAFQSRKVALKSRGALSLQEHKEGNLKVFINESAEVRHITGNKVGCQILLSHIGVPHTP